MAETLAGDQSLSRPRNCRRVEDQQDMVLDADADPASAEDFRRPVPTYFGETSRHEMFERTVWHSAQHTRQIASLLEQAGIAPDRPLGPADIRGLPLTDKIWDDA